MLMPNYIESLLTKIEAINPEHATKLRNNLSYLDDNYYNLSSDFLKKYEKYLYAKDLTVDFGVDCYLKMHNDMVEERLKFIRNGCYSSSSFTEVENKVYEKPEVMTYHMHGLVLGQFLWFEQYERYKFFSERLKKYFNDGNKYLEIGGGHGLYIYEATKLLPDDTDFDLVDISQTSLDLAKGILDDNNINYHLKNIFDFASDDVYDFITAGEVLEHVEKPLELLAKINNILTNDGICFLTSPINSPMIDHIYLFNEEQEIRELLSEAGFSIVEEKIILADKIPTRKAKKFKSPIMYACFVRKKYD